MASIQVRAVTKNYGTIQALQDITLEVPAGRFAVIVGPSGCGKSTLLRIMAGLIRTSSGDVLLDEKPVLKPTKGIGFVFQTPALLQWRDVISNIMLPAEIFHLNETQYKKKAMDLIKLVGLEGFEHELPMRLSGGMAQRVSLCRALLADPKVLLMDEPFGALDAITREKMNVELLRVWEKTKKTVVFVTHSISEAAFLGDTIYIMTKRPGRIFKVIEVPLARPRGPEILASSDFMRISSEIRESISTVDSSKQLVHPGIE